MRIKHSICYDDVFKFLELTDDGVFTWNNSCRKKDIIGKVAGNMRSDGYLQVQVLGNRFFIHRLVWIYHNGSIGVNLEIDHINGIKNDNRISNLRVVTSAQNKQNMRKCHRDSTTRVMGVYIHRGLYRARIQKNGIILARSFKNIDDARMWYIDQKRSIHEFCTI